MKTAESTVNTRILMLKTYLKLGQNEFCYKSGISTATYHNIKKGVEVRKSTARNIAIALKANPDWILTGEGEMIMSEEKGEAKVFSIELEQLKQENVRLQNEVDRLWKLIGAREGISFLKVLDVVGAKVIPLGETVAYSGATDAA